MPYSTPKFDYHFFETPCISKLFSKENNQYHSIASLVHSYSALNFDFLMLMTYKVESLPFNFSYKAGSEAVFSIGYNKYGTLPLYFF